MGSVKLKEEPAMKQKDLTEKELVHALFKEDKCPDCGSTQFYKGPEGGNSTNIKCANCGSKFNICPPWFAERI